MRYRLIFSKSTISFAILNLPKKKKKIHQHCYLFQQINRNKHF